MELRRPWWRRGGARRYGALALTVMVALAVMAFTYADRYMPVLTDWYLEMVLPEVGTAVMPLVDRGLPESTRTTPAPPDEPEGTGPNE